MVEGATRTTVEFTINKVATTADRGYRVTLDLPGNEDGYEAFSELARPDVGTVLVSFFAGVPHPDAPPAKRQLSFDDAAEPESERDTVTPADTAADMESTEFIIEQMEVATEHIAPIEELIYGSDGDSVQATLAEAMEITEVAASEVVVPV